MRLRIGTLPLAAFLALAFAPGASAGDLQQDVFGNLVYNHNPVFEAGQAHDVVVEPSAGGYRIADAGAEIAICTDPALCSPAPCVNGATLREALCPAGIAGLRVSLGGQNDRLENRTTLDLVACGGPGDDALVGGAGPDRLGGGPGRDELIGGAGSDNLAVDLARQIGQPGPQNSCVPGAGAERFEVLDGGAGRDQIHAGPGDDLVAGGRDDDILTGYAGDDRVDGGSGSDILLGLEGPDRLRGGDDGDFLFGGSGDDDVDGGAGDDALGRTIRYDADGLGGDTAIATAVESGDDRLDGGAGSDNLVAGPGDRVFDTEDSLALLEQGVVDRRLESSDLNGSDRIVGGPGEDLVTYVNRGLPVDVSLDGLANDGSAGERDRVDPDVERVLGGARADVLRADADGAVLFGDLGGDTILGGVGPDLLIGGFDDGADTLAGAAGNDELRGGPGDDGLDGGPGADVLLAGGGDDRALGGPAADGLEGGPGSDLLDGGAGPDCLFGFVLAGAEAAGCPGVGAATPVSGADGGDMLRGGSGIDRLAGGDGEDVADYADRRGRVVVVLPGAPPFWTAPAGADLIAADVEGARSGRGHDLLVGNAGDNVLDGGPGHDQVEGGRGVDRLRGGSGRDLLVSRDGEADAVRCGTKRDLALTDGADELVAALSDLCESVDGAGSRHARATRVRPGGDCALPIRPWGSGRFFLLRLRAALPPGTVVDASSCPARLRGSVARGGTFALDREGSGRRLELRLRGGSPRRCRGSGVRVRRLAVEGGGAGLTVRGRTLAAGGRGAAWTTIDGCRGTRVRVRSGRVAVSAEGRPRRLLGAGQSYAAPEQRP